ncbi:copper amine oxidase [Paenibacillus yonginensis]|uniref:Copper amine oxidase n=1 Tax=Paenibacillus yonginensis TaxID=1462996 RepID=A0A1B1N6C9_9BACL|nr:stalk domain-containing protein [Paenibacillus yonginensis]ANS76947.1 copper amine oxidase [Paenibacillus yonginensis]
MKGIAGRRKTGKVLGGLLLAAVLALPIQAGAAAQAGSVYKIVALGDSVTAGYEPAMAAQTNPTVYGYAERLKEQALFHGRAELVNDGILGLTSEGLANYTGAIEAGTAVAADAIQPGVSDPRIAKFASGIAQAKSDVADADLIVITIGGNDIKPLLSEVKTLAANDLETKVKTLLADYSANIIETIGHLRTVNPQALIVLADQYQPVPAIAGKADYDKLEQAAALYTSTVDQVVAQTNTATGPVKVAHVAAAFVGSEMSYTHILEGDIHPQQAGYEAIAKVFAGVIWGEYRQTAAAAGKEPISIVIGGQEWNSANKPILKNGQTFVAIGDIVQATHAASKWNSKTSTVTVTLSGRTVVIPIGSSTIQVNGTKVATSAPAFLNKVGVNSKTYVPLALLANGLGFEVQYSPKMKTAFINF